MPRTAVEVSPTNRAGGHADSIERSASEGRTIIGLGILVAAALLVHAGCASVKKVPIVDELPGVWLLQDYGQGPYEMTLLALLDDGRKCVVTFEADAGMVVTEAYMNRWSVDGNTLVTTFGPNSGWLDAGENMHDRILRLDGSRMDLFMTKPQGSNTEIHRKLPESDPERVCSLAAEVLQRRGVR